MISQQHARYLVVLVFALVIGTVVCSGNSVTGYATDNGVPEAEATSVSSCTNLTSANTEYQLTANVGANGTCFNITANNVTLDGNGFLINYSQAGGSREYGVYSTKDFTKIKNVKIVQGKETGGYEYNYAIYFVCANNGTIQNNTITTSGFYVDAVYLDFSSNYTTLTNNTITTSGNWSNGIMLWNSKNANITNNNITTFGPYSRGIELYLGSNLNIVANNTISTFGNRGDGIFSDNSHFNNMTSNTITTSGGGIGIYLPSSSSNNSLSLNKITTSGTSGSGIYNSGIYNSGIYIFSGKNNTLTDNTIMIAGADPTAYGIYFYVGANSNTIIGGTVNSTNAERIYIQSSNNNTFKDITLIGTTKNDTLLSKDEDAQTDSINNTFINVSYSTEYVEPSSQLIRQWYLDVYVAYAGTPIQNANITVWNVTGEQQFSVLSSSSGFIATQTLRDYINNGGTKTYASNYTVNVTADGFTNTTIQVNLSETKNTQLNVAMTNFTTPVITAHNITIAYPGQISVLFNFTDDVATDSFSVNDTTNWQINKTGYLQNITDRIPKYPGAALYHLNITVNDSANNTASVVIWINITDTTNPTMTTYNISRGYPANATGQFNFTDNYLTDSFSINETTKFKINKTGFFENKTDLSPATYWIKVTANDSFNNTRTATINVKINDTTIPVISAHNLSAVYPNRISVLFNFTDNIATDSFSVNDTTNWQINKTGYLQNVTDLNAATHWLNISANDTANNTATVVIWANITSTTTTTVAATTTTTSGGGGSRITTTSTVTLTTIETTVGELVSTIPPLTTIQITENMSLNSSQMISWQKLAEMVSNNIVKPIADVFAPKPLESIVVTESGNNVTITDLKSVDKKGIDKMVLVYENNTLIDEVYCSNVTVCRWIRDFEKRSEPLSYKLFTISATGSVTEKAFDIARFGHPDAQGATGEKLLFGMRLSSTWIVFFVVLMIVFFFMIREGYQVFSVNEKMHMHRKPHKEIVPGKLFKPAGYNKVKSSTKTKTNSSRHKSGKKHR